MSDNIENIIFSRFVKQPIPFEIITIQALYDRCEKSNFNLSNPHRIKFHALIIILEGTSKHFIDFNEYVLLPGTIIPLTKDQVHAFNNDCRVKGYVISFEESFITQSISEKNLFYFLHLYHTPSIDIGNENLPIIIKHITALFEIHNDLNNYLKAELIHTAFMTLVFQIKRLVNDPHEIFESKRFKDFFRFKVLLSQYYHESHNAEDYSKRLGVSYKYLNDICKEISNKTAKSFIDNWILLEIKRNISENKYTSKEIAYKMGFNEPSNFIRFFKKFTGTTPQKFQKSIH